MIEDIRKLALSMLREDTDDIDEDEDMLDDGSEATGGEIGSMGATSASSGTKYAPGTAPTMPESLNFKGNEIMEQIDKDVAAMLASLKKYDKLVESVAPVLGMQTLGEKKDLPPWLNKKDGKEDGKEVDKKEKKGDKKEKVEEADDNEEDEDKKKDKVEEGADPEVLDWMKRFSKLGNMKGYSR